MAIVCDVGIVGVLKQFLGLCHFMGHKGVLDDKGDRIGLYRTSFFCRPNHLK